MRIGLTDRQVEFLGDIVSEFHNDRLDLVRRLEQWKQDDSIKRKSLDHHRSVLSEAKTLLDALESQQNGASGRENPR